MPDPEIGNAIWVISDRTHDDHYLPVIQIGPDVAIPLTPDEAAHYARAVYTAAAHADCQAIARYIETATVEISWES